MFRSLIYIKLIFGSVIRVKVNFFFNKHPVFQHYLLKRLFFPLNCLGNLVKNQLTMQLWIYFWILCSVFCSTDQYLYLYANIPHCLDYCSFILKSNSKFSNFVLFCNCFQTVNSWNQTVNSPTLFFFFVIVLAITNSLHFHVNFRISSSISTEKLAGILIGLIKSVDQLWEKWHLNNCVFQSMSMVYLSIYSSLL